MPDLNFAIADAAPIRFAAAPHIGFTLNIENSGDESIHAVILRCQLQIEPGMRRYSSREQTGLSDLFGAPDQWARTVHSLLWANTSVTVPAFTGSIAVQLAIPATFDFNVAATKYFAALDEDGAVPLCFLFSGTVFADVGERLQVTQISWEKEAAFQLPASVWHELMRLYYPQSAWLCLHRDAFYKLSEYKRRRGLPTYEQTLDTLIPPFEEAAGQ